MTKFYVFDSLLKHFNCTDIRNKRSQLALQKERDDKITFSQCMNPRVVS